MLNMPLKNRNLLIISVVVIAVLTAGLFFWKNGKRNFSFVSGCNQLATTTDCLKITKENAVTSEQTTESKDFIWRKYENKELGISFLYPTKNPEPENWTIRNGDTGKIFNAGINLPSGNTVYLEAKTNDYTLGKGASGVINQGYVVKNGKYYIIIKGEPAPDGFDIVPDEIIKMNNGSEALFVYGKDYNNPSAYWGEPSIQVIINIPRTSSNIFTGIGFRMFSLDSKNMEIPASKEDLDMIKRIISSIEFINN